MCACAARVCYTNVLLSEKPTADCGLCDEAQASNQLEHDQLAVEPQHVMLSMHCFEQFNSLLNLNAMPEHLAHLPRCCQFLAHTAVSSLLRVACWYSRLTGKLKRW